MNNKFLFDLFKRLDIQLFLLSVLIFTLWPQLDIMAVEPFYDSVNSRFGAGDYLLVEILFRVFAKIHFVLLLALIIFIVFFHNKKYFTNKRKMVFLLCCLLVGPGVLVNVVLKDNSIGRPRPKQTELFGGEHQFTRAFEYSGVCRKNCSFVSGHAAIGFAFLALAWVTGSNAVFIGGVLLGFGLGLMRVAQGAHFPSDVVFSFWTVYFSAVLLAYRFGFSIRKRDLGDKNNNMPEPSPA